MIKSVKVVNHLGDTLTMEMMRPEKSGFFIKEITGIGPGTSNISTTDLASADGTSYNSARLGERNIVLKLIFQGELEKEVTSIENIRAKSYKYFPLKRQVRLIFETDNRSCYIDGYVEKNEPVIFSKQEETQISIICPFPYFSSVSKQITNFNGVISEFEFPFENNSLTEPLIEMGKIQLFSEKSIFYEGDAPTGIIITLHAIGNVRGFTIYNVYTKERITIDDQRFYNIMASYIQTGDDVIISTIKGSKTVTLLREGVRYNILNVLDKGADWLQIDKGDNMMAYTVESGLENVQLRIDNEVLYEGI